MARFQEWFDRDIRLSSVEALTINTLTTSALPSTLLRAGRAGKKEKQNPRHPSFVNTKEGRQKSNPAT